MTERLRLGIVGAGAITQVGHLPALKRVKEIEVVGLCDNDIAKARALADRFGVPNVHSDIAELVEYEALDALLICTPNHLHESHVLTALSHKLHVLVERPLAMTSAGAQKLLKAQQKHDRVVMIGANHRYRPDVQMIRSFMQNGELGDLESIRAWWFIARAVGRQSLGWRQKREQAGGGAMQDLGLALLDLSLWLAGFPRPTRVSAVFPEKGTIKGVEPSGTAMVALEGGAAIHLDTSWRFVGPGERFGVALRASKGSARISPLAIWKDFHGVTQDMATAGAHSRETPFALGVRAQWAHFAAVVRGEGVAPPLTEQVAALAVMEGIYESAETGRDVTL
jgi:predicted dehydrogenase